LALSKSWKGCSGTSNLRVMNGSVIDAAYLVLASIDYIGF